MKLNNTSIIILIIVFMISEVQSSTRKECPSGDHHFCKPYDGEGSCCAQAKVLVKVAGNTENVGDIFYRCYDFDAVLASFDNNFVYEDSSARGGNGNTYQL